MRHLQSTSLRVSRVMHEPEPSCTSVCNRRTTTSPTRCGSSAALRASFLEPMLSTRAGESYISSSCTVGGHASQRAHLVSSKPPLGNTWLSGGLPSLQEMQICLYILSHELQNAEGWIGDCALARRQQQRAEEFQASAPSRVR